jgi:ribonuclease P protein component
LTTSAEFQALFHHGKRIDRPTLLVLWELSQARRRAGFAVSRQIRGAVRRNRARRRVKEAFRAVREAAPLQVAVVVIAKRGALEAPFATLSEHMREALSAIPRQGHAE